MHVTERRADRPRRVRHAPRIQPVQAPAPDLPGALGGAVRLHGGILAEPAARGWHTGAMRDAFDLDPEVTHLNHGSFGAVPRPVSEEQERWRRRAEANPMRFFRVESPSLKERARAVAAETLGVDELALVRNVTQATGALLSSLAATGRLAAGDVVVLGEQGYESVRRSVARWCERTGASYDVVAHPPGGTADDVVAAFRSALAAVVARGRRPRLVVTDHITSPTGSVLPVAAISAAAHEVGALCFVDAAHVPGQLPARPADTGADYWAGTWHKWGFAPRGTSALWVAAHERDRVEPLTTGWNHGLGFPAPFDTAGTDDYSGWYCLERALEFWRDAGGPEIAERGRALLDDGAKQVAAALPAVEEPLPPEPAPCLRLVALPGGIASDVGSADRLYRRLSDRGVEVQVTPYSGRGFLRLSAAVYNEPADYERLADVLPGALAD